MPKIQYFSGEGANFKRNIHSSSKKAKNSFIYLQESGELTSTHNHSGKRSQLESYLFFIVTDGSGTLTYDGKVYTLKKNCCVLIDCMNSYRHVSSENCPWSLKWAHFFGKPATEFYNIFLELTDSPVFYTERAVDFVSVIDRLITVNDTNPVLEDVKNAKLLGDLCLLIAETVSHHKVKSNISEIIAYLDEHFTENLSLEGIAADFFISKYTLAHNFKESVGTTVLEYITKQRIRKAKELLRYTDKTIEQISEECGICDANYFSKIFKKSEGHSARDYRKKW